MPGPSDAREDALTRVALAVLESCLAEGRRVALDSPASPVVSVVLVLHNRAELTLRCLLSLRGAATPVEVVIVDNASSDATPALLERLDGARVTRNAANLGFLRGANQAAGLARGELLLFLNNDCELLPGSLDAAVDRFRRGDEPGAVVGKLVGLDGRLQEAGSIVWRDGTCTGYGRGDAPLAPAYMFERDVDYGSGALLLTPRGLFLAAGGFDDAYAPAYYEDADYALRLWAAGRRVVYEPRVVALHHQFASAPSIAEALEQQAARRPTFEARRRVELGGQPAPDPANVLGARSRTRGLRVLFVDDRVPHASLGQGYPRALEVLASLARLGHEVTHYPLLYPNESWESVYASVPRDVEVMRGYGLPAFEAFQRERASHYDVVIVSRGSTLRALRDTLGDAAPFGNVPWIYDAEALDARRDFGRRELAGEGLDAAEAARRIAGEVALARGARAVTCVTETEAVAFREAGHRVGILGHAVLPAPGSASFEEREGLLFVGAVTDDASPNADALVWFVTEVMPRIESLQGRPASLTIAGLNGSARVAALLGPNVRHVGALASLAPLYDRARTFVAPLRFGAGLPLKACDAAAHGVPMVASGWVGDQLGWSDRNELRVAPDADGFAQACVDLDADAPLWRGLRDAALARVSADYSREVFDRSLEATLAAATGGGRRPLPTSPPSRPMLPHPAAVEPRGLAPARLPDDRSDRIAQLEAALGAARHDLAALRASLSWRVTAPLRALHAWLRGRG
jgi:GT2 family glycosyltransferase